MKNIIFNLLPKYLKTELIRRSLDISNSIAADIEFKVAETESEFEQAFRLVHDAYVREGFIDKQNSGLRVIPQHQLPSTHVLIAKKGHEVIGTLTLVRNSKVKLPLERVFALNSIQGTGVRVAEVTCLSVKSEYRRAKGGTVFANLMKFMYEFSAFYAGIDELVVAVFPKDAIFYESLLCFSALEKKPVDYLGAPAIALHLNLQQAPELFRKAYNHRSTAHNLYHFFVEASVANFSFPKRLFCEINYPTLTTELAQKFFTPSEKSNVIEFAFKKGARNVRAEVSCSGEWKIKSFDKNRTFKVMDISGGGVKIMSSVNFEVGSVCRAVLKIGARQTCDVTMEVKWKDTLGTYGLSLIETEPVWLDFVAAMTVEKVQQKSKRQQAS